MPGVKRTRAGNEVFVSSAFGRVQFRARCHKVDRKRVRTGVEKRLLFFWYDEVNKWDEFCLVQSPALWVDVDRFPPRAIAESVIVIII